MNERTHEHRFPGDIHPKEQSLTLTEYKPGSIDWRKTANIKPVDVMNNLYLAFKEFILGEGDRSLMVVSSDTALGKSYLLNKALKDVGCEYVKDTPDFSLPIINIESTSQGAVRNLPFDNIQAMFNALQNYSGTWLDEEGKEHERIFVLDNDELFLEDKCAGSYLFHLLSPYPYNRYLIDHVTQTAYPFQGRFIVLMNRRLSEFVENDRELKAILDGYAITRDIRMNIFEQYAILEDCFQNIDLDVEKPTWSLEEEAQAKDDALEYISENIAKVRCYGLLNSFRRIVLSILNQSKMQERISQMGSMGREMFGNDFDWHDDADRELHLI